MYEIGDEVVLMSAPGRFRIVAVDGPLLTVESESGVRKRVLVQAVRTVSPRKAPAT
jgi:hypothetical protein